MIVAAAMSGAASLLGKGANLVSGIGALFSGAHPKDRLRIAGAQAALQRALAGDQSAVLEMKQQAGLVPGFGSATAVGKAAYKAAYDAYLSGGAVAPDVVQPTASPIREELTSAADKIRDVLADSTQKIGAGVTNAAADKIGSSNRSSSVTLPLTKSQLYVLAGIAGLLVWFRR